VTGHRWFAALYDPLVARRHEDTHMKEIRPRVVAEARGRVLEIGAGTGNSLAYYRGNSFQELVVTEPDPFMMRRLRRKLADAAVEAHAIAACAERLPFPDASFDTVISTCVLCTVRDVDQALAEISRVLDKDGRFAFFEHVRARHKLAAGVQSVMRPAWAWLAAGCRPDRAIVPEIEASGLRLLRLERSYPKTSFALVKPHVFGVATKAN
jgi:ubiquinone/menaquinone biosynthesis C-methylase UbiE